MNARAVFDEAVELPKGERTAYLNRVCAETPELREEVDSLLRAHAGADGFLHAGITDPTMLAAAIVHDALRPGARLGRYSIVRLIGAGGMGAVYLAEQDRPRRTVALKVVRAGIADPAMVRRFEHESQILASLQHPGIAQVYEAGTHTLEAGAEGEPVAIPYFAMEHVAGARSLTTYAEAAHLDRGARIELLCEVCDAMQYAHRRGVIHRDLKPGNILVGTTDDAAARLPKIIDFGIARVSGAESILATQQTTRGQIVGTLRYMSPEQCGDDVASIDTRSDVYALGVILYELLTGRAPYELKSSSLVQIPRIIREMPATRPSLIDPALRGDLETILLKALEKEPDARYQSAGALADDLRRFLGNRPILARPPSVAYQFRKFARRRRALVAGGVATLAMLVLGAIGTTWQAIRATQQRDLAREQKARAEWSSYVADVAAADSAVKTLDAKTALARLADAPEHARNWEWRLLARQADRSIRTWRGPKNEGVVAALASPDSTRFAALLRTGDLMMVDARTFEPIWRVRHPGDPTSMYEVIISAFSRDGSMLSVGMGDTTDVWDARTGAPIATLWCANRQWGFPFASFARDNTRMIVSGRQNELEIYELPSGKLLRRKPAGELRYFSHARFMPDGASIAVGQPSGIVLIDAQTFEERDHIDWPHEFDAAGDWGSLAVSDDGRYAYTHSFGSVIGFDLAAHKPTATFIGHTQRLGSVCLSPDGRFLASIAWDGTLRVWESATGKLLSVQGGHSDLFWSVSFIDDGKRILTSSRDGSVKVWEVVPTPQPWIARPIDSDGWILAWLPGGNRLFWSGWSVDGFAHPRPPEWGVLDADARTSLATSGLPTIERSSPSIAFDSSMRALAMCGPDDTVLIWNRESDRPMASLTGLRTATAQVVMSPDGRFLVGQDTEPTMKMWDVASGVVLWHVEGDDPASAHLAGAAFSPDGSRLVSASFDGKARVRDTRTGEVLLTLWKERDADTTVAAWSPDGTLIVTASDAGEVRFWNARDGALLHVTSGLTPACWALGFSPDGTRVAVGVQDRTVRILDVTTGTPLLTLDGFTGTPTTTLWSPDGRYLAVGCRDRTIRIWDARSPAASSPE